MEYPIKYKTFEHCLAQFGNRDDEVHARTAACRFEETLFPTAFRPFAAGFDAAAGNLADNLAKCEPYFYIRTVKIGSKSWAVGN